MPIPGLNEWVPAPEVTTHDGTPIEPEMEFFAPPPQEIGALLSAHSTLRRDKLPLSLPIRIAVALVPALLAALVLAVLLNARGLRNVPIICVGVFVLVGPLGWFATRFRKECSYVGTDGLARLTCKDSRDNITEELFLFRDAVELRTGAVALYQNAVYQGTKYEFRWLDASGANAFVSTGVSFEPGRAYTKRPKRNPEREFAEAAESAWTSHLFTRAQAQLKQEGRVSFRVGKDDWVEVGRDFLEFHFKGQAERCSVQEIGGLEIDQGSCQVTLRDGRSDGPWKRGQFEFPMGEMSNSQLFCRVCDKLLGPRLVSS